MENLNTSVGNSMGLIGKHMYVTGNNDSKQKKRNDGKYIRQESIKMMWNQNGIHDG